MKKFKALMVAFVMAGMTVVSCSSDDSGPVATIDGKWNQTKTVFKAGGGSITQNYEDNTVGCTKNYIEFAASGVYNDVVYFKQGGECVQNMATPGTWVKNDKSLTINNGGFLSGTYNITKLSGSDLEISSTSNEGGINSTTTVYFKKASN